MPIRQLIALSICTLISMTGGNIVVGLLPVYITRLGGDAAATGAFFSFTFLNLTLGSFAAGWLAERFQKRKLLLILAGIPGIIGPLLMSQTADITLLALINGLSAFFGGMGIALINTLVGLFAPDTERGKVFGILAFAGAIGGLIGGFLSGPIADRWDFPVLLQMLAAWSILFPLAALFVKDKVIRRVSVSPSVAVNRFTLGRPFYILFLANIFVWLMTFVAALGRPLIMNNLGFDTSAISSAFGIGAAVTLPLPPLIGWLSDRVGRTRCLALCYLLGGTGILILIFSGSLWHFWASTILISMIGASMSVGLAQVADLVPRESLDVGISLYSSTSFIGGIVGFASSGYIIQFMGMGQTLLLSASLSLLAVLLLMFVRLPSPQVEASSV
jgi:MFS family permease